MVSSYWERRVGSMSCLLVEVVLGDEEDEED